MNNETMAIVDEEERQAPDTHDEEVLICELGEVSKDTKGWGGRALDTGIFFQPSW